MLETITPDDAFVKHPDMHGMNFKLRHYPIGRYLDFYNRQRPHSSLDRRTPDEAYFDRTPCMAAA
jgi:hypothetical protein